jgi:hypothetical protein
MDTCASVLDPEQPRLYYAHNFVMVSTSSEHHYITSALYNADTLRDLGGRPEPFIVIADSSPDPDLSTNAAISRDHLPASTVLHTTPPLPS